MNETVGLLLVGVAIGAAASWVLSWLPARMKKTAAPEGPIVINAADVISPVEIALAAMKGMLANPAFGDTPEAAAGMAWNCIPSFYDGFARYHRMLGMTAGVDEGQARQAFEDAAATAAALGGLHGNRYEQFDG